MQIPLYVCVRRMFCTLRTSNTYVRTYRYKPKRTTSDFEPDMSSRVQEALDLALGGDDDYEVSVHGGGSLASMHYGEEEKY